METAWLSGGSKELLDQLFLSLIVLDSNSKDPVSEIINIQAAELQKALSVETFDQGSRSLIKIDGTGGYRTQVTLMWDGVSLSYLDSQERHDRPQKTRFLTG